MTPEIKAKIDRLQQRSDDILNTLNLSETFDLSPAGAATYFEEMNALDVKIHQLKMEAITTEEIAEYKEMRDYWRCNNLPFLGWVKWQSEKDRYNNPVSIIIMNSGIRYRMVHHSKPHQYSQRMTIYAGRNKFVKARTYANEDDCCANSCTVKNYSAFWGDGDMLDSIADITGNKIRLSENNDAFIVFVLHNFANVPDFWECKSTSAPGDKK